MSTIGNLSIAVLLYCVGFGSILVFLSAIVKYKKIDTHNENVYNFSIGMKAFSIFRIQT